MEYFLSGGTMMGAAVAALFFLRFWRQTHDRFFALFALAFGVLSVNRIAVLFFIHDTEPGNLFFYIIRLAAFLLILIAIVDKNRTDSSTR